MRGAELLLVVLAALCCLRTASSISVNVLAHREECFYEQVSPGTDVGLTFQVTAGGFLDIDVKVRSYSLSSCFIHWLLPSSPCMLCILEMGTVFPLPCSSCKPLRICCC